ncbi:uncharacterized protein LOC141858013 [Brevipalpus obovatus]|uniref:uncharacterized protein LOC141858013 n=1 Tax=Brevipalpus obovatus TaxID=246614 RepID=UPI003D9F894A
MGNRGKTKDVTFSNDVIQLIISDDENEEENMIDDDHRKPFLQNGTSSGTINGHQNSLKSSLPGISKIRIMKPKNRRRKSHCKWLCCVLILIVIILFSYFLYNEKSFLLKQLKKLSLKDISKKCSKLSSEIVWNVSFPMLTVRSALKLSDVNNDGILDIIIPFGTGADDIFYSSLACSVYFNITDNYLKDGCGGGLMVLEGKTGSTIFKKFVRHELSSANCEKDLTDDGIKDCVVGGRLGSLYAFNMASGDIIWSFRDLESEKIDQTANFYAPLYLSHDLDNDGVEDMVLMHGGHVQEHINPSVRHPARLIVVSSRKGAILSTIDSPDRAESYFHPISFTHNDGSEYILYGTGSKTSPGSLFTLPFDSIFHPNSPQSTPIFTDCCQGIIFAPIFVDTNHDSRLDLILALPNATVLSIDGFSFQILWQKDFPNSQILSPPSIGLFDEDDIPDIFVVYQTENRTQVTVLNAKNGEPLIQPIVKLVGTQSSPLTISIYGPQDIFLFWLSTSGDFTTPNLVKLGIHSPTGLGNSEIAGIGPARVNSSSYSQMMALSMKNYSIIYDSRKRKSMELAQMSYFADIGERWLEENTFADNTPYQQTDDLGSPLYQGDSDYAPTNIFDYSMDRNFDRPQSRADKRSDDSFGSFRRFKRTVETANRVNVQQIASTGTLAPSDKSGAIDVIFAIQWSSFTKPPSSNPSYSTSPSELENCLKKYLKLEGKLALDLSNKFAGIDHDNYVRIVREKCSQLTSVDNGSTKNPLSLPFRSITLYRKRIWCSNNSSLIRPYHEQIWPSYMGLHGNSIPNIIKVN